MMTVSTEDPVAVAVVAAIRAGDLASLRRLLADHPGLAAARIGTEGPGGMARSLLHVVTDWPGHFPNGAATVALLVGAGADVHARFHGSHQETPLHWAASSNDVAVGISPNRRLARQRPGGNGPGDRAGRRDPSTPTTRFTSTSDWTTSTTTAGRSSWSRR